MISSIDQLHLLILNVGPAVHDGDWNWQDVSSPFTRLYYVTRGSAQINLPDKEQTLRPGHLYLIPAFTSHSYHCNGPFEHYYLHIYEDHQSDTGILEDWHFPTELPATPLDLALFQRLCEMNPTFRLTQSDPSTYDNNSTLLHNIVKNKQRAFCDKVESRGIVYQLIARFLKHAQPKSEVSDDRMQKVLAYIRKNLHTSISIEQLANTACLSKDHFIRLFKRTTGSTPLHYINQKKVEKAQLLLLTSKLSIKSIALALAFEDHSYFNRLFRKTTGMTPQQYRMNDE
ncbi:MAG: helix-turn-helix transcriptional regulator [Bacteroides sp.]|nr:helix-turn-helix transcriptional regulator [Bacteroides sp.]